MQTAEITDRLTRLFGLLFIFPVFPTQIITFNDYFATFLCDLVLDPPLHTILFTNTFEKRENYMLYFGLQSRNTQHRRHFEQPRALSTSSKHVHESRALRFFPLQKEGRGNSFVIILAFPTPNNHCAYFTSIFPFFYSGVTEAASVFAVNTAHY